MPNILTQLELTELSLVDRPANPLALAPVFKADLRKGDQMTEDMKEKLKPYMDKGMSEEEAMKAYEEDMKKALTEAQALKAENERLRKALIEGGFVIKADSIEKKAPVEYIEVEGEQINKADIPAPILKSLEEAQVAKREAEVAKRAEVFPNIKPEVAKALVEKDLDEDEALLEFLRAVDAMFAKAMEETGETQTDADMVKASDKLEKMAKDYASEHKVSFEKGYAEVLKTKEGKELFKEMKDDE
jgi:hypothetical protein